jgi:predicted Zn finger-like uncharacterized protein
MLIVCTSCATSYNVEPASLLRGGRSVRCLRCRTAWQAETPCHINARSDNARRNVVQAASVGAAGHPVLVNRAAGRERVVNLDAFELIRNQAHEALNVIRARCREDHSRILNRLGAPDAMPPQYADKPSAGAATIPLLPDCPEAGWDANTRMKISRAFAETLADAPNEMAPHNCADEYGANGRPRTGNEPGLLAAVVDDALSAAAVDEAQEGGGWIASVADKQDTASVAALAEIPANELIQSAELEELPTPLDLELQESATAPVDVEVEDLSTAPVDPIGGRLTEINTGDSIDHLDGPLHEIQPTGGRSYRGRTICWWPLRWPMSRLQTAILVLFTVDCILVGWRPEVLRALPQASSFYKLVGLSVNLGGLAFDGVATTTEQRDGVPVLVLRGKIINDASTVANVSRLKFIVRNATRQEIYSWTALPSRTLLPPGEAASFRTELVSPPPDANDVLVRFVDPRDIVAEER